MIYQKWYVKERVEKDEHLDKPTIYYDIYLKRDGGNDVIIATSKYKDVASKICSVNRKFQEISKIIDTKAI